MAFSSGHAHDLRSLGRMRPTLTSPGSMLIVKLELDTMSYELISDEASSKSKWADQWGRHTLHLVAVCKEDWIVITIRRNYFQSTSTSYAHA